MIERKVTHSKKDKDGDIIALCNPGNDWSPRFRNNAISDIKGKLFSYYVIVNNQKVEIKVVNGLTGEYLRTDPDKTTKNNLDDLPNC